MQSDEKNLPPLRKAVIACNGIPLSVKQELPQKVCKWWITGMPGIMNHPGYKIIWKSYRRLGG